jgi:hypothetical protein
MILGNNLSVKYVAKMRKQFIADFIVKLAKYERIISTCTFNVSI